VRNKPEKMVINGVMGNDVQTTGETMKTKSIKLPTITELTGLFRALKKDIHDDFRAEGMVVPSMDVTVGWTAETGAWNYQTGDNSFTGGAYGHRDWAVVVLTRRSNSRDIAVDVRDQLSDQFYSR
jgi:hypothetical protein